MLYLNLLVNLSYNYVAINIPFFETKIEELENQIVELDRVFSENAQNDKYKIEDKERECSQECTCTNTEMSLFYLICYRNGLYAK